MSAAFLRNKLSQSLAGLETAAEGRRSRAVLKEKRMEINYGGQKTSFPSGGVIRRYFDCFLRGTRGGKMLTVSKLCMFCTVCCVCVHVLKSVYFFFPAVYCMFMGREGLWVLCTELGNELEHNFKD